MAKATTPSSKDDRAPSTPQEKAAAAEYAKKLDAELDAEFAREDGVDAPKTEQEEPAENLDSENETEQEQEKEEVEESTESKTPEETIESEKEPEPEDPKEKRYREQLAGERKANAELQTRLQALEAKIVPQQQKELSPEEQQILAEKQFLKEKYGLVEKQEVIALLDARLQPVQKKREQTIFQNIYSKFPDVSPDKDSTNEKWQKVTAWVNRILPANTSDPLDDYEERFELAHAKVFGNKTFNGAQARQASYTNVGGGSSAAKSRTTVGNDKYAHFTPEKRAYKAQLDAYFEKEEQEEEIRKKRK